MARPDGSVEGMGPAPGPGARSDRFGEALPVAGRDPGAEVRALLQEAGFQALVVVCWGVPVEPDAVRMALRLWRQGVRAAKPVDSLLSERIAELEQWMGRDPVWSEGTKDIHRTDLSLRERISRLEGKVGRYPESGYDITSRLQGLEQAIRPPELRPDRRKRTHGRRVEMFPQPLLEYGERRKPLVKVELLPDRRTRR